MYPRLLYPRTRVSMYLRLLSDKSQVGMYPRLVFYTFLLVSVRPQTPTLNSSTSVLPSRSVHLRVCPCILNVGGSHTTLQSYLFKKSIPIIPPSSMGPITKRSSTSSHLQSGPIGHNSHHVVYFHGVSNQRG